MEEKDVQKKQTAAFGNRVFLFGLEIIGYFGIPALAAVLAGKSIQRTYTGQLPIMTLLLVVAYVGSWVLVVFRYRAIKRSFERKKDQAAQQ